MKRWWWWSRNSSVTGGGGPTLHCSRSPPNQLIVSPLSSRHHCSPSQRLPAHHHHLHTTPRRHATHPVTPGTKPTPASLFSRFCCTETDRFTASIGCSGIMLDVVMVVVRANSRNIRMAVVVALVVLKGMYRVGSTRKRSLLST